MGVYRDDNNKPYILSCVRKAEKIIYDKQLDHEYTGIEGIASYFSNSTKLSYGADSTLIKDGRVAGAQSISGTRSLRLGFSCLSSTQTNRLKFTYQTKHGQYTEQSQRELV
jgi:aspartate aminotransferase